MPFINNDDLNRLRIESSRAEELADELRILRTGSEVVEQAMGLVRKWEEEGELPEMARAAAEISLGATLREERVSQLKSQILEDDGELMRTKLLAEHGSEWYAQAREALKQSGELDRIRDEANRAAKGSIYEKVLADCTQEISAELKTEEAKERIMAEVRADIQNDGTAASMREQLEEKERERLRAIAEQQLLAEITDGLAAKEKLEIEAIVSKLRGKPTQEIIQFEKKKAKEHRDRWAKMALEEVLRNVDDEVSRSTLQERIAQITKEVEMADKEARQKELCEQFEGSGIDLDSIPEGEKVTLSIGKYSDEAVIETDRYGKTIRTGKAITVNRIIMTISLGGGRFKVISDTLADTSVNNNQYIQDTLRSNSLSPDLVVTFNNASSENGETTYSHLVTADSALYYDDDTTNDDVQYMHGNLAQIEINGLKARIVEKYEKTY